MIRSVTIKRKAKLKILIQLIPHVKICRLDGNIIDYLTPQFFGAFTRPKTISIQRNRLSSLPADLFSEMDKSKTIVDLRFQKNKSLTCMAPALFMQKVVKLRV